MDGNSSLFTQARDLTKYLFGDRQSTPLAITPYLPTILKVLGGIGILRQNVIWLERACSRSNVQLAVFNILHILRTRKDYQILVDENNWEELDARIMVEVGAAIEAHCLSRKEGAKVERELERRLHREAMDHASDENLHEGSDLTEASIQAKLLARQHTKRKRTKEAAEFEAGLEERNNMAQIKPSPQGLQKGLDYKDAYEQSLQLARQLKPPKRSKKRSKEAAELESRPEERYDLKRIAKREKTVRDTRFDVGHQLWPGPPHPIPPYKEGDVWWLQDGRKYAHRNGRTRQEHTKDDVSAKWPSVPGGFYRQPTDDEDDYEDETKPGGSGGRVWRLEDKNRVRFDGKKNHDASTQDKRNVIHGDEETRTRGKHPETTVHRPGRVGKTARPTGHSPLDSPLNFNSPILGKTGSIDAFGNPVKPHKTNTPAPPTVVGRPTPAPPNSHQLEELRKAPQGSGITSLDITTEVDGVELVTPVTGALEVTRDEEGHVDRFTFTPISATEPKVLPSGKSKSGTPQTPTERIGVGASPKASARTSGRTSGGSHRVADDPRTMGSPRVPSKTRKHPSVVISGKGGGPTSLAAIASAGPTGTKRGRDHPPESAGEAKPKATIASAPITPTVTKTTMPTSKRRRLADKVSPSEIKTSRVGRDTPPTRELPARKTKYGGIYKD